VLCILDRVGRAIGGLESARCHSLERRVHLALLFGVAYEHLSICAPELTSLFFSGIVFVNSAFNDSQHLWLTREVLLRERPLQLRGDLERMHGTHRWLPNKAITCRLLLTLLLGATSIVTTLLCDDFEGIRVLLLQIKTQFWAGCLGLQARLPVSLLTASTLLLILDHLKVSDLRPVNALEMVIRILLAALEVRRVCQ